MAAISLRIPVAVDLEVEMPVLPHDVADLRLAPVVLTLDARIEELSILDLEALRRHTALVSDTPEGTRDHREHALLRALEHGLDLHGWQLSWNSRGVRASHDNHHLVLGIPATFVDYLAGVPQQPARG